MNTEQLYERLQIIQVARFIAASIVLCTHITLYMSERAGISMPIWRPGESGVPIFFAISGLVIFLSARKLSNSTSGAIIFLERRFARVVPLYWLATAIKVIAAIAVPSAILHNHFQWELTIRSFLLIPTFTETHHIRPIHGVGWTLLHEVYFYLIFSVAIACTRRPALITALFITVAAAAGIQWKFEHAPPEVWTSSINLHFVAGILSGYVLQDVVQRRLTLTGSVAAAILLASLGASIATLGPVRLDSWALLTAILIPASVHLRILRFPRLITALGDSSYSLYLFHPFIAAGLTSVFSQFWPGHTAVIFLLTLAFTIAAGHAIYLWIEQPLVKLTLNALKRIHRNTVAQSRL